MPHWDRHNEETQAELREIASHADRKEVVFRKKSSEIFRTRQRTHSVSYWGNSDAIATLQCESLSHIFAEYVEKGRPCPISVKQAVAAMYEEYTRDTRHNHVAKDYLDRLMALPAE